MTAADAVAAGLSCGVMIAAGLLVTLDGLHERREAARRELERRERERAEEAARQAHARLVAASIRIGADFSGLGDAFGQAATAARAFAAALAAHPAFKPRPGRRP